jgi:hypothetical protein
MYNLNGAQKLMFKGIIPKNMQQTPPIVTSNPVIQQPLSAKVSPVAEDRYSVEDIKCDWDKCLESFPSTFTKNEIFHHILDSHLNGTKCGWKTCAREFKNSKELSIHVKLHMEALTPIPPVSLPNKHKISNPVRKPSESSIPLTTSLVIRNFARASANRGLFYPYEKELAFLMSTLAEDEGLCKVIGQLLLEILEKD